MKVLIYKSRFGFRLMTDPATLKIIKDEVDHYSLYKNNPECSVYISDRDMAFLTLKHKDWIYEMM